LLELISTEVNPPWGWGESMTCHGYYSACDRLEPLELPLSRPQLAMRMLRVLLHVEFLAAYEGLWVSARAWFKVYIHAYPHVIQSVPPRLKGRQYEPS
jgi:hypothetical protein